MSNMSVEITLIAAIFITGIALCFVANFWTGMGFIFVANISLPFIIKFAQTTRLVASKA